MTETERNTMTEQIISELVNWAQEQGYYPVSETSNPFAITAFDIAYEIENPKEHNLATAIERCKEEGCFKNLKIRKFETEFPNPAEYIIAMNENGTLGIFFENSFGWCGNGYKRINQNQIPKNWFANYEIFNEWSI